MIRTYFLQVILIDGGETVRGADIIHHALLETTANSFTRLLIMDTTPEEHTLLIALADSFRDASPQEIEQYTAQVFIIPPDPDTIRAQEILATSPAAITMPELWELLRIYGRRLGF